MVGANVASEVVRCYSTGSPELAEVRERLRCPAGIRVSDSEFGRTVVLCIE